MKPNASKVKLAENSKTSDPMDAVKIQFGDDLIKGHEPISIPNLFDKVVNDFPERPAFMYKNSDNKWTPITYSSYLNKVRQLAKVFIKLGLEERHSVGILAYNSPEWVISEMAAIHAGGIAAGIYTTNSPDAVHHVLNDSNANIVIVDTKTQLEKIRLIKNRLPNLKAIIQIEGPYDEFMDSMEYKWSDIEEMNVSDLEDDLNDRLNRIYVNECCCLIYTSGTVGNPKGAMLSHDNVTWNVYVFLNAVPDISYGQEIVVSYLPMNHMASQLLDVFLSLKCAATIYFADRDALKSSLIKILKDVRPTIFLGVPRVFEKMYEYKMHTSKQNSILKTAIIEWARNITFNNSLNLMQGKPNGGLIYRLAKKYAINDFKKSLGFDRCHSVYVGAAPLAPETKKFFFSYDILTLEVYGMSEIGVNVLGLKNDNNLETIGKKLNGTDLKIIDCDANGHGEICVKGRHVFMGYIGNTEKTLETIDADNWLHTGDVGYVDENDFVYVTGRIKELIITAGGENIPPVHVENLIKAELPGISNAVLIGDKRKFLSVLLTIKTEMDPETGKPADKLQKEALDWMQSLSLSYTTLSEILKPTPCSKVLESIRQGINRANKNSISNAHCVQKFEILPHDFSVETGELGPTLKLKRSHVIKMYEDIVENFYK